MAKSIQIASVFTALGFKVNKKDLDRLQKQLGNLKKQIRSLKNVSKIDIAVNNKGLETARKQLSQINQELAKVRSRTVNVKVNRGGLNGSGGGGRAGGGAHGGVFKGAALGSQLGQFGPGVGAVGLAAFGGAGIFKTTTQIEATSNALSAAAGSAEEGAKQMVFLRETSDRIGINFLDNARSYTNFLAASNAVGFSVEGSQEAFTATASAARVLGLSAADTNGAMRAMTQILSKGTVQAEELRGQLGERVPGAVGLMAKAVGQMKGGITVTVAELGKMLEQGEVISKDVMPFFAKELQKFAETNNALARAQKSPLANLERMKNAFVDVQDTVGRSQFVFELSRLFQQLSENMKESSGVAETFGVILSIVVNVVQAFFSLISGIPGPLKAVLAIAALLAVPFLLIGTAIAGVILLLDDLVQFFNGKTGGFFDNLATFMNSLGHMDYVYKIFDGIKRALAATVPYFEKLDHLLASMAERFMTFPTGLMNLVTNPGQYFSEVGKDIKGLFGDDPEGVAAVAGNAGPNTGYVSDIPEVNVTISGQIEGATFEAKTEKE